MAEDLITTTQFLAATGQTLASIDPDTGLAQIEWGIASASAAIRSYTDRKFELVDDADPAPRQFRYYGGLLEIDDCESINSITIVSNDFTVGRVLDSKEWYASAVDNPDGVFDTVELYTVLPFGVTSPAMGFTYNLDNYPIRRGPVILEIDAVWGWPELPQNVLSAAVITSNVNVVESDPSALSAEAIAGYSRSFSNVASTTRGGSSRTIRPYIEMIPIQAIALLDPYIRVHV